MAKASISRGKFQPAHSVYVTVKEVLDGGKEVRLKLATSAEEGRPTLDNPSYWWVAQGETVEVTISEEEE